MLDGGWRRPRREVMLEERAVRLLVVSFSIYGLIKGTAKTYFCWVGTEDEGVITAFMRSSKTAVVRTAAS
jgi:hypothetical protein